MDFFARQERSRRTTRWLVLLFALAFAAVALATTAVAALVLDGFAGSAGLPGARGWGTALREHAGALAGIGAGTLGLMLLASGYRAASLSRGGGQVARMLGATRLAAEPADALERRLVNVVEEMAIASGLPVPEIYVLEEEPGINAFAAGLTQSDAAVTVTRGALERLDRAELQGVIAHEFSHILNGDMRINQRLIGFSFGILVLSLVGRWLLRSVYFTRRSRRGVPVVLVLGLALIVIGAIGVLLSRLIKAAVSRQRETLADASAVQFTREPSGLAGALKKIGGFTADLSSVESEEVAHMLFGQVGRRFGALFATHPPLTERIRAIDPSFEPGDYPAPASPLPAAEPAEGAPVSALGPATAEPPLLERAGLSEAPAVGEALVGALPGELRHAARGRESSLLLVLALALSDAEPAAAAQQQLLEAQLGKARARRCASLRAELRALDPRLRLPLLELCMPALKQRPAEQLEYLFELVERLLDLDGERQLFDYALLKLLAAYLGERPGGGLERGARGRRPGAPAAAAELLAVTAAFGHREPPAARAAFRAGAAELARGRALPEPDFEELEALRDTARLDAPLARLAALPAPGKRRVLNALLAVIRHDRKLEIGEIELFRAIAATLGCPLPPSVSVQSVDESRRLVNMAGS